MGVHVASLKLDACDTACAIHACTMSTHRRVVRACENDLQSAEAFQELSYSNQSTPEQNQHPNTPAPLKFGCRRRLMTLKTSLRKHDLPLCQQTRAQRNSKAITYTSLFSPRIEM